jgi:hypothetical protein
MSDLFAFDPIFSQAIIGIIIIAGGALFIYLELKKQIRFKGLRITAIVVMLLALTCLLLRPSVSVKVNTNVILLTPGYNPKQVDSIAARTANTILFHTEDTKGYKNSKPLQSYHELARMSSELKYVVGQGLPSPWLETLDSAHFKFINSQTAKGIIQLSISDPVFNNQSAKVSGVINDTSVSKLLLEGPGGKVDSMDVKDKKHFKLSFTPKQPGSFLYTISVRDNKGNLQTEKIPVNVRKNESLKILFAQQFPTFETQYLKKFLALNHQLALRYQVSKNTFRYEFLNHNTIELKILNKNILGNFDLLVIDSDAFQQLSALEKTALQKSIYDGLGVIILFNQSPDKLKSFKNLLPSFNKIKSDTVLLDLGGQKKTSLPTWPVTPAANVSIFSVTKSNERIVSGYRYYGFGKAAFQLLQETYRTSLQGDSVAYSMLWSNLVAETSRRKERKYQIQIKTPFPYYPDVPIYFDIIGTGQPKVLNDSTIVALEEDFNIDNVWHGKTWAGKPGWHRLHIPEDSTSLPYYVSNENDWQTLYATNTTIANESVAETEIGSKKITRLQRISPLVFYILLLISAAFLWIVPKV